MWSLAVNNLQRGIDDSQNEMDIHSNAGMLIVVIFVYNVAIESILVGGENNEINKNKEI